MIDDEKIVYNQFKAIKKRIHGNNTQNDRMDIDGKKSGLEKIANRREESFIFCGLMFIIQLLQ